MNVERLVPWRRLGRALAAALLVGAGTVLLVTVEVRAGGVTRSCGSAWDVVAGRSGWQQWWALDQADPSARASLLRTEQCPGAVNARIVTAAVLTVSALVVLAAAAAIGVRARFTTAPGRPARRIVVLGMVTSGLGIALTVGGLVAIALLVADPNATLFLYVDRPTVVLLGLVLLLPAAFLVVLGRAAGALAEHLLIDGTGDDPT